MEVTIPPLPKFQVIEKPVLAAKGLMCFECLQEATKLDKCANCRRVSYCSKKCQKANWKKDHKRICQVLVDSNNEQRPAAKTWEEYRGQKFAELIRLRQVFGEVELSRDHEKLVQYQVYCGVCYRTSVQLSNKEFMKSCPSCRLANFCSSCAGIADHPCDVLQEVRSNEQFYVRHYFQSGGEIGAQWVTSDPRRTYMPLSKAPNGWYDYFTKVSDGGEMFVGSLSHDLKDEKFPEAAQAVVSSTDKSTMMITILAALEVVITNLSKKTELEIHLVGATGRELYALLMFEEILHLLPTLKSLHCAFVGPDVPTNTEVTGERSVTQECCPSCSTTKRTRSANVWAGYRPYHEYAKLSHYKKPDLAVAFHSGHTQEAQTEWLPSIQHLAGAGHATLFTSYNKTEMSEETSNLEKMGAHFIQKGGLNLWRGARPFLESMEKEENAVYYLNEYWYIIGPKE